jgi:hypothetical protein
MSQSIDKPVFPHRLDAGDLLGRTDSVVRLLASPDRLPLSVELTLERHVYLDAAELLQACGVHARTVAQAYKDAASAVWRQILACPNDPGAPISLDVSWRAIANATPGVRYAAVLTVRDARGERLAAIDGFRNPQRSTGQIGPVDHPTDHGRLRVAVLQIPTE